jgi:nucleoprotein TPR
MSMRTRRKSKQAAAAAAAAAEPDNELAGSVAPFEGSASSSRVDFSVPFPDDIDLEHLSRLLPGVSFEAPSQEALLSLYRFVTSQAVDLDAALRDLEDSRAEVERKEVELDQVFQDRESSVLSLETQVKSLQEELAKVKEERNTFGKLVATCHDIEYIFTCSLASSKSNLESQVSSLSSSQSISSTELDCFRHRVDDVQREKRDLLSVVSRLKEDSAQRDGVFFLNLFCCHVNMPNTHN